MEFHLDSYSDSTLMDVFQKLPLMLTSNTINL